MQRVVNAAIRFVARFYVDEDERDMLRAEAAAREAKFGKHHSAITWEPPLPDTHERRKP
jgi:hypothetical protein